MKLLMFLLTLTAGLTTWHVLVDHSIRAAALLLLTFLFVLLLRNRSASSRHLVWALSFSALLLIPVISLTLPSWNILPGSLSAPISGNEPGETGPLRSVAQQEVPLSASSELKSPLVAGELEGEDTESPLAAGLVTSRSDSDSAVNFPVALPEPVALNSAGQEAEALERKDSEPAGARFAEESPTRSRAFSEAGAQPTLSSMLVLAWAIGCLLLLGRLLLSHLALLRLGHRSHLSADSSIQLLCDKLGQRLSLRGRVRLILHEGRTMPMSWGLLQNCILLPSKAEEWSEDRLRSVLMHELGHLKRRDPWIQVLVQFVCALYWFHPLVWLAAWRMQIERERSCDDLVLCHGVKAPDYAQDLLDVVAGFSSKGMGLGASAAIGMARPSRLEGRLVAIMNEQVLRSAPSGPRVLMTILPALALVVPLAMIQAESTKPHELESSLAKSSELERGADPSTPKTVRKIFPPGTKVSEVLAWGDGSWKLIRILKEGKGTDNERIVVDFKKTDQPNQPAVHLRTHDKDVEGWSHPEGETKEGKLLWRFQLSSQPSKSPEIVGGDTVVVEEDNGNVIGIDLSTGKLKWRGKPEPGEASGNATSTSSGVSGKEKSGGSVAEKKEITVADMELLKAWQELIVSRENVVAMNQMRFKEGKVSAMDLGQAQLAVIEAQIGYAKVGGKSQEVTKLHIERIHQLESLLVYQEQLYKNGESELSVADLQRAQDALAKAKIERLQFLRGLSKTAEETGGRKTEERTSPDRSKADKEARSNENAKRVSEELERLQKKVNLLKVQLASMLKKYGENHPRVLKSRGVLDALTRALNNKPVRDSLRDPTESALRAAYLETLAELEGRKAANLYGENHPELRALQNRVRDLEKELNDQEEESPGKTKEARDGDEAKPSGKEADAKLALEQELSSLMTTLVDVDDLYGPKHPWLLDLHRKIREHQEALRALER